MHQIVSRNKASAFHAYFGTVRHQLQHLYDFQRLAKLK